MIRSRRAVGLATVLAVFVMLGAWASSAVGADFTLKFGYVTGPTHPFGLTMAQFKNNVETASGGRIAVQLIPVYAGGDDIQLLNDIKGNTVAGGGVSTAVWAQAGSGINIKSFIALQMPFLIDNYQLEQKVINNSSGIAQSMLRNATQSIGLKGLGLFEGGMRQLALKNGPIHSLADLRGLKLRSVQSDILEANESALGLSPTPIRIGDVFGALSNGTVSGMEANDSLVNTFKFYDAGIKHMVVINWFPFPAAVVMNQQSYNQLPPDLQKILVDATKDLPAFSIQASTTTTQNPVIPTLCAKGVRFSFVSKALRKQMILKSQKVYRKFTLGRSNRQTARYVAAIQKLKAKTKPGVTEPAPADCIEK